MNQSGSNAAMSASSFVSGNTGNLYRMQENAFLRAIHQYRLSYNTAVEYSKYVIGEIDTFRMLYILEHCEGAKFFYSSMSRDKKDKLLSWEGVYILKNGVKVTHTKKGLKFQEQ